MEPTKKALQDLVKQIAASARKNVKKNGSVDPVAFFIGENLPESRGLVLDLSTDEMAAKSRQLMQEAVADLHPVAVVAVLEGEMIIADSDEEAETISALPEHPRKKKYISVQASSPIANHEVLIEYSLKGKRVQIGEEYGVLADDGGCEFTRGLWGVMN